jgi:hypothetical protein
VPQVSEDALIAGVEQRLIGKYSALHPGQVATVVKNAHAAFAESRVRDFVPLLVERRAHHELSHFLSGTVEAAS